MGATGPRGEDQALADLIARIGARVGLEAITRARPADSHIPRKDRHAAGRRLVGTGHGLAGAPPGTVRSRCFAPNPYAPQMTPTSLPVSPGAAGASKPARVSAPNASRRNGGWTIPTGARACATTGAWSRGTARCYGYTMPMAARGPEARGPAGSPMAISDEGTGRKGTATRSDPWPVTRACAHPDPLHLSKNTRGSARG